MPSAGHTDDIGGGNGNPGMVAALESTAGGKKPLDQDILSQNLLHRALGPGGSLEFQTHHVKRLVAMGDFLGPADPGPGFQSALLLGEEQLDEHFAFHGQRLHR